MPSSISTPTEKTELFRIARRVGGIQTIYDIGALHALDGIQLALELSATELHTFECNPPSIITCRHNLKYHLADSVTKYHLCESAVADKTGFLTFNAIDTERTITPHADGNPGASSLFRANGLYNRETYVQKAIQVAATTIDAYASNHSPPDLLWIDLQGAEVLAFQGGRKALSKTKIIFTEVGFRPMYSGQALYRDIDRELRSQGFVLHHLDVGRWPKIPGIYSLMGYGPWIGNAIYARD